MLVLTGCVSPGVADASGEHLGWSLRRAPYDVELLFEASRSSGIPYAGWWASFWRPAG